jgi:hypothetical protein
MRSSPSMVFAWLVSIILVLGSTPLAFGWDKESRREYDGGPLDMSARAKKVPEDENKEPVATPLDEQWKWLLAGAVIAMIGYTGWRFWSESTKTTRKPQPWEVE